MKNNIMRLVFFILFMSLIAPFSIAQDEAKYEFSGKVGGLSPLSPDYESTVMIELDITYSITKHIAISGGAVFCNFLGPSEILIGGEELLEYLNTFAPLRIDAIRMDEQIFTAKIILKTGGKKVSPFIAAGIGGYQFYYKQNIFGKDPIFGGEISRPIYYKDTVFGINAGGGLDFYMNDFLSLKFEGCYHRVFHDFIQQQLTFSGGFGFMF